MGSTFFKIKMLRIFNLEEIVPSAKEEGQVPGRLREEMVF